MTTASIIAAAVPYAVQAIVAIALGTHAAYWTAHNVAVERTRWIGARPLGALPAEDSALRARHRKLRRKTTNRARRAAA